MGSDKKHKSEKRKRKHSEEESNQDSAGDSDSSLDSTRREKASFSKKHKKKSHKSKKKKKSKRSDKEVSKEMLEAAGQISDDDYFEKHAEFSTWLLEEKSEYFNELSSEKSRSRFSKFVEAWNSGKLSVKYYNGIPNAPIRRTQHKWTFNRHVDRKDAIDAEIGPTRKVDTNKPSILSEDERIAQQSKRLGFLPGSFKPPPEKPAKVESPPRWKKNRMPDPGPTGSTEQESKSQRLAELQAQDDRTMAHFRALLDSGGTGQMQIRKREDQ